MKRPSAATAAVQKASTDDALRKQEALTYLRELKERLKDKKDTYDEFLEIMKEFKGQRIDTEGVIKRVKTIFKGHKDLILGFNQFLPKGHEIRVEDVEREEREEAERVKAAAGGAPSVKPQVEFVHAISYVNKIKTRFANDERVYKAFLEILNMYRKNLKSISQVYEEVALLFKSHNDLLEEFTYFLPDSTTPGGGKKAGAAKGFRGKGGQLPGQPGGALKRKGKGDKAAAADVVSEPAADERKTAASLAKELAFFEKVKARLRNREAYNELIKCLNIFNSEVISKMELQGLVWDILGRYPELHSGFSDFLARCESMDFEFSEVGKGKDGKMSAKEMQKMKVISAREKFLSRPISELDLSACERCGPSYRLLPKNFPKAPASARTPLCLEHLNDNWVSVTSGSEDYSFKAMRKNQYEESLFRCEDDRFELDMVLETNKVTMVALEPIIEKLKCMTTEEASHFRIPEGALSPVHLRAIERLYGIGTDHGQDIRRMILDYPAATSHVVMARLKQKDIDWKKVKVEVAPIWVDVYEKNYNKSLDHRSFYFKQTDKKALSAKGMAHEIKEVSDKKKSSEDAIGCGGGGALGAHAISPDLTFMYADRKVHDDVYAVLRFSTHEMMNTDHAERVMKTWREFVEPFFGICRADPDGDYVDDSAEQAAVFVRRDDEDDDEGEGGEEGGGDKGGSGKGNGGSDANSNGREAKGGGSGGDDAKDGDEGSEGRAGKDLDMADANAAKDGGDGNDSADKDRSGDDEDEDEGPDTKKRKAGGGKGGENKKSKKDVAEDNEKEEQEEENNSDDDDAEERVYAACKPLSGAAQAAADDIDNDEETTAAAPLVRLDGKIFYGHDGYYLLFRLHQHLYERLATARASAVSMSKQFGQKVEPEAVRAAKEREIHNDFLRLLFKLLNGTVESSSFEDDCRTLLGANSYVLFTLDKLIYKIVKQTQSLLADETASKLLHLYEYEAARTFPFVEAVYHANASVLLLGEACYRFGSVDGSERLTLQLMEAGLDKADLPAGIMAQFHEYLEGFLQTAEQEEGDVDAGGKPWMDRAYRPNVYLSRAKHLAGLDAAEGVGGVVSVPASERLGKVTVFNSLECKISCSNSKVSYVLDTEDVFHRTPGSGAGQGRSRGAPGKAAAEAKEGKACARFRAWLAEKEAAMPRGDEAMAAVGAAAEARVQAHAADDAAAALAEVEAEDEDEVEDEDEEAAMEDDYDEDEAEEGQEKEEMGDGVYEEDGEEEDGQEEEGEEEEEEEGEEEAEEGEGRNEHK